MISNILSVAKYESKILIRSWFFKVFTVLAILILGFFDFALLIMEDSGGFWLVKAIPATRKGQQRLSRITFVRPAFAEYRAGSDLYISFFGVPEKG